MEEAQKFFRNISNDLKSVSSSPSSSESPYSFSGKGGLAAALPSSDQSRVLISRPTSDSFRQMVSLWTCSKFCAIFFVAGVVVGFTLKRRVRRWASKLLKRLKDD